MIHVVGFRGGRHLKLDIQLFIRLMSGTEEQFP